MRLGRISINMLLAMVGIAGLALASVRGRSDALFLLVLSLLGVSALRSVALDRGPDRASCLGFALTGGIALLLLFLPPTGPALREAIGSLLPNTGPSPILANPTHLYDVSAALVVLVFASLGGLLSRRRQVARAGRSTAPGPVGTGPTRS